MHNIRTTFRSHFRNDPGLEQSGTPSLALARQLNGYHTEDPAEKHEKALPVRVFRHLYEKGLCPIDTAIGELTTMALFFAMRSCEYSSVPVPGKTKLITLQDIDFYAKSKKLHPTHDDIASATSVSITFRNQKNGKKNAVITQHRNESNLCPVKAIAKITSRILSYPDCSLNSPVNTIRTNKTTYHISSTMVLNRIRDVVKGFGPDDLGFLASETGTHSIRSSTAMQLHINKVDTYQIMLIGRWSSDAFLRYIRPQILEFSEGLSSIMVEKEFFTLPEPQLAHPDDPLTRNPAPSATASSAGRRMLGARFPPAAVHTWQ